MNTETGAVYLQGPELDEARRRGEPLVLVSAKVAQQLKVGQRELNRRQRRAARRGKGHRG